MHLRKTELNIPTDRRQTSWLFTSGTIEHKSSLCTDPPPPTLPPLMSFPIFPEGKVGGGVCIQARTNPTSRQGRTWTRGFRIQAHKPLGNGASLAVV